MAAALRETLTQCQQLEEQEAAAAVQATAGTAGAAEDGEPDPEVLRLRARAVDLRGRLEEKNQLIKAAIDRLRQLLDALCMWDSSRRELNAAVG